MLGSCFRGCEGSNQACFEFGRNAGLSWLLRVPRKKLFTDSVFSKHNFNCVSEPLALGEAIFTEFVIWFIIFTRQNAKPVMRMSWLVSRPHARSNCPFSCLRFFPLPICCGVPCTFGSKQVISEGNARDTELYSSQALNHVSVSVP